MTYFAVIKLYDQEGHKKEFVRNGIRADKAIAEAINFLKMKDGDKVSNDIIDLLIKDFQDLGKRMFKE